MLWGIAKFSLFIGFFLLMGLVIMIPLFANKIQRVKERGTIGNLGAIRSTLRIYYEDTGGRYPSDLAALTQSGKYMRTLPRTYTRHTDSNAFTVGRTTAEALTDAGGWAYLWEPPTDSFTAGTVLVNCTHTDSRGKAWTSY